MRWRYRRGVGSLIAGLFIILILIAFIASLVVINRSQGRYGEVITENIEKRLRGLETNLEIEDIEVLPGNVLNITVSNLGSTDVYIKYIGVFNSDSRLGHYYNASEIGISVKGVLVNRFSEATNISTYEALLEDLTQGRWIIQLLTVDGVVASSEYPLPIQEVPSKWGLIYSPRNFPGGSAVTLASTLASSSYTPTSVTNITGNYVSGDATSLSAVDGNYYIVSSIPDGTTSRSYYPSSYNIISGYLISGTVGNLASNDGVYQSIGASPAAHSNTLYTHNETVNTYYKLRTSPQDNPEFIVFGNSSRRFSPVLLASFIYPLRGIGTIPNENWTVHYRAWYNRSGDPSPEIYINISILHSDGRTTPINETFAPANLTTEPQTLMGQDTFPGYNPNETDYLLIQFYFMNTRGGRSFVFLTIEDSSLSPSLQTRIVATSPIFPTKYGVQVEYIGTSNTASDWLSLFWLLDSQYDANVNVTIQLYDYLNNIYPTSGDGYLSYVYSTPNVDQAVNQTIVTAPERFRDASTGEFKVRITATRDTDFNEEFIGSYDYLEYTPTYYKYTAEVEARFSGLSSNTTISLTFELVLNHSEAPIDINIYLYNFRTGGWDSVYTASYNTPNTDTTYTFSVTVSPQDYVSNGVLKSRVKSDNSVQFEQRINYYLLNQTYVKSSAIYIGRGGSSEFYCLIPSTLTWLSKASAPFTFIQGSSMTPLGGYIYAINGTDLFSYSIQGDSWSYIGSLPAPGGLGSVIIALSSYPKLLFYIPGGTNLLYAYDIQNNAWTQLSSIPEVTGDYAVATTDGAYIYLLVDRGSDAVYKYDYSTDTWSLLTYTVSSKATGLFYYNNKIYLVDVSGIVSVYDVTTGVWSQLSPSVGVYVFDYGNRLVIDGRYAWYVRVDATREVYYISLNQLG